MTTRVILPNPVAVAKALLADTAPAAEVTTAQAGMMDKGSRGDHKHPRLTSAGRVTLGADGTAAVTYTRSFTASPSIVLTAINPTGRAVQLEIVSDTKTGALFTGCVVKGYRSQLLPSLGGIVLIGPLLTALGNFDVLGGSASGVEVSVIALEKS